MLINGVGFSDQVGEALIRLKAKVELAVEHWNNEPEVLRPLAEDLAGVIPPATKFETFVVDSEDSLS